MDTSPVGRTQKRQVAVIFKPEYYEFIGMESTRDWTVDGLVIDKEALIPLIPYNANPFEPKLTFKEGSDLDKDAVQESRTKEWCIRIWYDKPGHPNRVCLLLPLRMIAEIEENIISTFSAKFPPHAQTMKDAMKNSGKCADGSCGHGHAGDPPGSIGGSDF